MLRHQAETRGDTVLDLQLSDVLAGERRGAFQRQDTHDGIEQRGLAGAVGADDGDDLVVAHFKRHRAHRLDLAIGDVRIGDLQQRAHDAAPR